MPSTALPAVASMLAGNLTRLKVGVYEYLQDPVLIGDAALEPTIETILDRLCLSIQLAKPIGLGNWALREGRRLGRARAAEVAEGATLAIAGEAARYGVDQARLLALLDLLKGEVQAALSALDAPVAANTSAGASESADALLAMLAERDGATCRHSKATAEWARRLCTHLRLDEEIVEFTARCALFHDLGKVATPDAILLKPGPLTESEWVTMREHSAAGERILKQIPSLARCAPIVRAHHERWDGAGYPDGLRAGAIPLEARIVAVADAFHAMISRRPYRKPIPPRRALEILDAGGGTQWERGIVDAMLGLFQKGASKSARQMSSA